MLVNLYSEDLKLLANTINRFLYNILIILVRKKMQILKLVFLFFVIIPMINLIPEAESHPLFNSSE